MTGITPTTIFIGRITNNAWPEPFAAFRRKQAGPGLIGSGRIAAIFDMHTTP
jgi:hypothetical protein